MKRCLSEDMKYVSPYLPPQRSLLLVWSDTERLYSEGKTPGWNNTWSFYPETQTRRQTGKQAGIDQFHWINMSSCLHSISKRQISHSAAPPEYYREADRQVPWCSHSGLWHYPVGTRLPSLWPLVSLWGWDRSSERMTGQCSAPQPERQTGGETDGWRERETRGQEVIN